MRHPYFHKAVTRAFDKLLPQDTLPSYFIYFEADPQSVDVNIHPTKTEIKFEHEQAIWQILMASVREALGKFNLVPSIDFNTEGVVNVHIPRNDRDPVTPDIPHNPDYNPFEFEKGRYNKRPGHDNRKGRFGDWEELYRDFEKDTGHQADLQGNTISGKSAGADSIEPISAPVLLQLKNRYILSPVKSGLMIIDQKKAHERILYEKFLKIIRSGSFVAQQQLYPVNIELSPPDYLLARELTGELAGFGFDITDLGPNSIVVSGCPVDSGLS
jgi:DNA mismatch repair protein MutL